MRLSPRSSEIANKTVLEHAATETCGCQLTVGSDGVDDDWAGDGSDEEAAGLVASELAATRLSAGVV